MVQRNKEFIMQKMILLCIIIFFIIYLIDLAINHYHLNKHRENIENNDNLEGFINVNREEKIRRYKSLTIDPDEEIDDFGEFNTLLNEPFQNMLKKKYTDYLDKYVKDMDLNMAVNTIKDESKNIINGDENINQYLENINIRHKFVKKDNVIMCFFNPSIDFEKIKNLLIDLIPVLMNKIIKMNNASKIKNISNEDKQKIIDFITENLNVYLKIQYDDNDIFKNHINIYQKLLENNKTINKDNFEYILNFNEINPENKINKLSSLSIIAEKDDINNSNIHPKFLNMELRYNIKNFSENIDLLIHKFSLI